MATKNENTEQALRESEEKYRTLFNSIDEGFCTIEVLFDENDKPYDYRFLEVNPAFEQQTGIKNGIGRTILEFAPQHEPFWFEIYGRIARTGEAERFEHEAAALGKFYDVYAFRVGLPGSNRLAIIFSDISKRKNAEKALQESENRFRLLVTASSEIVYKMSADLTKMYPMEGKGFLPDVRAVNVTWLGKYVPESDRELVQTAIDHAKKNKAVFELEHRVTRADGSVGWAFSRAIPFLDANGEIIEWYGTASDITTRKTYEEWQAYMLKLSDALPHMADPHDIQDTAMRILAQHLNVTRAQYWEVENNGESAISVGGYSEDVPSSAERVILDDFGAFIKEGFCSGTTLISEDILADPRVNEAAQAAYAGMNFRAFVAVPLLKNGRCVLVIGVLNKTPRKWSETDIEIVEATAERTWQAVVRARVETALRKSEERFRTTANLVPDLLWDTEPDGATYWYNQQWMDYTGQSFEKAMGWGWTDVIHPDDLQVSLRRYADAVRNGAPLTMEHRIRRHDGQYRWFVVRALPLRDEKGNLVKMYAAATDMHAQRVAFDALRKSEEKYRSIFTSIDEGFVVCELLYDENGKPCDSLVMEANNSFHEMMQIENAVGKTAREIFPDVDDSWFEIYQQVVTTGTAIRGEKKLSELNRWFQLYISRIGDEGSKVYAIIFNDITGQKQIEERQLVLLQQKDEFIGIASHELKTPVTSIKVLAELIEEEYEQCGEAPRTVMVGKLIMQVDRLTKLINDLLNTNNIEKGRMLYENEEVDINELITERVEEVHRTAPRRKVVLQLDTPVVVTGDRERLAQVVVNLMSNAFKYSPEDKEIVVSTNCRGNEVVVKVRDEGIGIPVASIDKVFDRFYRVEGPSRSTYPGMGLGLYISSEIIKNHGGVISVSSKEGKGSEFSFSLPVSRNREQVKENN